MCNFSVNNAHFFFCGVAARIVVASVSFRVLMLPNFFVLLLLMLMVMVLGGALYLLIM